MCLGCAIGHCIYYRVGKILSHTTERLAYCTLAERYCRNKSCNIHITRDIDCNRFGILVDDTIVYVVDYKRTYLGLIALGHEFPVEIQVAIGYMDILNTFHVDGLTFLHISRSPFRKAKLSDSHRPSVIGFRKIYSNRARRQIHLSLIVVECQRLYRAVARELQVAHVIV